MGQRAAWATNCREWCKGAHVGLIKDQVDEAFAITDATLAAITDVLDADIAVEDLVTRTKMVYKSAHSTLTDGVVEKWF